MRKMTIFIWIVVLTIALSGCCRKEEVKEIRLEERKAPAIEKVLTEEKPIRIAVGGMITPKEGFGYYRQLLDYIGEKLKRPVEFVDRKGYAEINELMKSGNLEIAFACSGPYVDGHEKFGMELLVAPQAYGKTVYYSYIIVPIDSAVENFKELRGKTFAFTDPLSNTGKLVPTYMLARMGETPDSFFKKYIFTYAHDKSIKVVAQKLVDGSAVDSLIWEYANHTHPEFTSKTKIIERSPPYGIPPVVVHPDMDAKLKKSIREILLGAHLDEKGKKILKGMMIDKFVVVDDSLYDSIRKMKTWLAKQKGKG